MKHNEERLNEIMARLEQLPHVPLEKIPEINLYMDQVTSFMEEQLKSTKRNPEDKALTKTMINNYAKNRLLPPPVKKKYSREHMVMLLFIYYYKNLLSFADIEQLFLPLTSHHFGTDNQPSFDSIYEEIIELEKQQMEPLREDVRTKYQAATQTFADAPEDEREYLQLFAFISELSFDAYLKKQIVEQLIDQFRAEEEAAAPNAGRKKR
ncbi:MAG: DUF1836 domain-containing protein [Clostridiales bacterium]|nr:DUF1836 domain-containing protein [Clostridiales bacterium]